MGGMITNTRGKRLWDEYPPFYFVQVRDRAFVHRDLYDDAQEAVLAAYDANRLSGCFTCLVTHRAPTLRFFIHPEGKYPPKLWMPKKGANKAFAM